MHVVAIFRVGLFALCAACSPVSTVIARSDDSLCAPKHETSPFFISWSLYWRKLPPALAPDESVVEALPVGTRVGVVRRPDTEFVDEKVERACTCVEPAAFHQFRITRVVSGSFGGSAFEWWERTAGCGAALLDMGASEPPADGKPAYLVIRPTPEKPPEGATLPVMNVRFENQDPPCTSRPGGAPPAPGC